MNNTYASLLLISSLWSVIPHALGAAKPQTATHQQLPTPQLLITHVGAVALEQAHLAYPVWQTRLRQQATHKKMLYRAYLAWKKIRKLEPEQK